ncbi:MAG: GldG family protein [Calditrichaceae bacterium]|nr:GldG family protein [Calditrichaceae bacterium]MBN2707927.1 GldG family protein [Calditrichaceae bacterium]RQV95364.1 MAG: hypothetical protein EH224_07750 [Calditrichota bacterium]
MKKIEQISGLAGIILLAASLIWYSITYVWGAAQWILLVLGVAGIAYSVFIYFTKREKALSSQSMKSGANVVLQVIIMLAIVSMIGFITIKNNKRFDLTENKLYSLSEQSAKLVMNLDKDVEIKAFYQEIERKAAEDLLDEYKNHSGRISYEVIDPQEKPDISKRYGINKYNMVVVESGQKREIIDRLTESNLTNAIIKVTREQDKVIYFLTGHGERSINDDQQEGFKALAEAIRKDNHLVREINLLRQNSIPDSCTVLAVVSPKMDLFPVEYDTIRQYLNRGGKVILMADPEHPTSLNQFLAEYHLELGNDIVLDVSAIGQIFGGGPAMPLVTNYDQNHAITKEMRNIMSFFPWTSSVWVKEDRGGYTITELCKTSDESWAEMNLQDGKAGFDEGLDKPGPITLAAIAEKTNEKKMTALILFGNSAFASNAYLRQQGNLNLIMNTVNYLADEGDLISIRPKEIDDRRLTMTAAEVNTMFYLVVVAIPLLVVIVGVVLFFRRNR